jgi:hypothetical protein
MNLLKQQDFVARYWLLGARIDQQHISKKPAIKSTIDEH